MDTRFTTFSKTQGKLVKIIFGREVGREFRSMNCYFTVTRYINLLNTICVYSPKVCSQVVWTACQNMMYDAARGQGQEARVLIQDIGGLFGVVSTGKLTIIYHVLITHLMLNKIQVLWLMLKA